MFTVHNADFRFGQDHQCNCVIKHPPKQNSHVDTAVSQCPALDQGLIRKQRVRWLKGLIQDTKDE